MYLISVPPPPALYLSMDHISGSSLPADIGAIQGTLENAPLLVPNAVRGKALRLDGVNQAVNLGNQRHRCLGKDYDQDSIHFDPAFSTFGTCGC